MKTSNKLLLGIFLTILILTTTVQLMVYAKYKRGDYTAFKREDYIPMVSLPVPAARFISMKGFGTCAIKPSDTLKMEIQKDNAGILKYKLVNDTLFITSNSMDDNGRNNTLVNIYLPATVQLNAANCTFRVYGTNDLATAPSYNISIQHSYLFMNFGGAEKKPVFFNQLNLNSVSSTIDLSGSATLKDLNLRLTDSKFNDQSAGIVKMTVASDGASRIDLSGNNANALK